MTGTWYKPGSWNRICDRTGRKIKAEHTRQEWNGLIVRTESWEPRHPQDYLRSFPDDQSVDNPRPDQQPWVFLATNEVDPNDL